MIDRRTQTLGTAGVVAAALAGFLTLKPAPAPELDPVAIAGALSMATQVASEHAGPAVVGVRRYESGRWGNRQTQRGSGVIVRAEGVVVTNAHVIRDADEVRVALQDGSEVVAEVLGIDDDTDLAILRIPGDNFPFADLELERDPVVGEWVLAMGDPYGLDLTVTMGIVSGTQRGDLDIARYEDFIQTDAAINPGNSGGPLVDLNGKVIGINTAMGTPREGSTGIGYATPASFVNVVVESILSEGRVRRGRLGVNLSVLSDSWGERLGYHGTSRVVVSNALVGGPAAAAGLERSDVIESIGGKPMKTRQQANNAIGLRRPGEELELVVWRAGERLTLVATLEDQEAR
ncbi:S1C family serine protease [Engelhardtia mirabilis]|uniref:Putative periplasmic serine endoprotease DegP-like n=1 Tax=Engelhardtia mirabilis TaxID=2528011 RepID=A0A518BNC3_9BACT|nr:putative periplasmic serine endoprotease DegP-like precursor [Planctomycetes bacterium Pla133]QDV02805.1 putative periplasmic serine endoprotease DegP-like precursor [Planctomycetes bacterium Pla86]